MNYSNVHIWSIVGGTASARLWNVSHCVVEVATVRCHFIAEEFGREFPVVDLQMNVGCLLIARKRRDN